MTLKTLSIAAFLSLSPLGAFAMCTGDGHETTASICTDGLVWDQETGACVEQVTG